MSDRHEMQAAGTHPAPCARHCESTAYEIEIRRLRHDIERHVGIATEATQELEQLRAEIERLNSCLRYEQHRADRLGTHGPGCETWGPAHYECVVLELAASREREARMRDIGGQLSNAAFNLAQRPGEPLSSDDCSMLDRLRKQWDAALAEGAQG